jgi:hypothetical protein
MHRSRPKCLIVCCCSFILAFQPQTAAACSETRGTSTVARSIYWGTKNTNEPRCQLPRPGQATRTYGPRPTAALCNGWTQACVRNSKGMWLLRCLTSRTTKKYLSHSTGANQREGRRVDEKTSALTGEDDATALQVWWSMRGQPNRGTYSTSNQNNY